MYLCELAMQDSNRYLKYYPFIIAASAVSLASQVGQWQSEGKFESRVMVESCMELLQSEVEPFQSEVELLQSEVESGRAKALKCGNESTETEIRK